MAKRKPKQEPPPEPPKIERYGKVSDSFGKPNPKPEPGACTTCGAYPPCH